MVRILIYGLRHGTRRDAHDSGGAVSRTLPTSTINRFQSTCLGKVNPNMRLPKRTCTEREGEQADVNIKLGSLFPTISCNILTSCCLTRRMVKKLKTDLDRLGGKGDITDTRVCCIALR